MHVFRRLLLRGLFARRNLLAVNPPCGTYQNIFPHHRRECVPSSQPRTSQLCRVCSPTLTIKIRCMLQSLMTHHVGHLVGNDHRHPPLVLHAGFVDVEQQVRLPAKMSTTSDTSHSINLQV